MSDSLPNSLIANIEELLKQIQAMNLFDDIFTSVVFKDEGACLHLVRQLMQNPKLNIIAFRTQDAIPMLISKSPRLDITAEDDKGTLYEIEIQRLEEAAPARRVRYYSSVMDSELLRKGVSYDKLPEVYLFYISEEDIWRNAQVSVPNLCYYYSGQFGSKCIWVDFNVSVLGFNSGRHDYPDLHKKQEAVPVQVPSVGNTKASKLC